MMTSSQKARPVVLIVEDEPLQRMMAVDMVEHAGFEPVEATDATDAVRILESRKDIRIVFTDIDMPRGLDGMKLAAVIRDRWPPIEIILISGQLAAPDVTLPARAVFFPKPVREKEVIAEMRRMAT